MAVDDVGWPCTCVHGRGTKLRVLFVCTGNICRSPIAERLAEAHGAQLGIPRFDAISAGTRAVVDHPVHHHAAAVLESLGGDASNFAAQQLTAKIASNADLVLTMTRSHRDKVLEMAPRSLPKTFTLAEAAQMERRFGPRGIEELGGLRSRISQRDLRDIADPIGREVEAFAAVGAEIADLLIPVLDLCRRSSASLG